MAEHVHLFLKANGKDIKGESSQKDLGREDSIECLEYEQGATTPVEPTTGQASGRRQYTPLKIRKRIDASSPLLWVAMTKNEKIEGTFKFYRPNPDGDGTHEQFYTVEIKGGYISGIHQMLGKTIVPGVSIEQPMEEVVFVFHEIFWTYNRNGAQHKDSWSGK